MLNQSTISTKKRLGFKKVKFRKALSHWQLYLVVLLPIVSIIIFSYVPMYGITLAFKDYSIRKGISGSPWVGFGYFIRFFNSPSFWQIIKNTILLSIYSLMAGFPFPIVLAILLNECRNVRFKKTVQMVTYAPYFISTVVMVAMLQQWMDPRLGFVNKITEIITGSTIDYFSKPAFFSSLYVWSGIWQYTGFNSIIYIAALAAINPELHEAAVIDGASRIRRIWHIDLPGILPTIIILLILNSGQLLNVGFEKIYLMQNPLNSKMSEVITTYVYKVGLIDSDYSFSTAVGLFNSVINLLLLSCVNSISRRYSETSLW